MLASNALRLSLKQAAKSSRSTLRPTFRKYSTEAPKQANRTPIYIGVGALFVVGAGYWAFNSSSDTAKETATKAKIGGQILKSNTPFKPAKEDYQKVYNKIASILEDEYDGSWVLLLFWTPLLTRLRILDGSYGPVLVRLAWHSSGTYDKESKTGGRCAYIYSYLHIH